MPGDGTSDSTPVPGKASGITAAPGLIDHARALLDTNRYMTLATIDPDGRPWATPVFFAADGLRIFYWVSEIETRHSRNLIEHRDVSLDVFDSTVPPYHGRAVYAAGHAHEAADDQIDVGLAVYPGPVSRGATVLTREDVTGPSPYRLYLAVVEDLWILCPREPGQPCTLHGFARDHRTRVHVPTPR